MGGNGLIKLIEECAELLYTLLCYDSMEGIEDEVADVLAIAGFVQEVWKLRSDRGEAIGNGTIRLALAECIQVAAKVAAFPDAQFHPDGSELRPRLALIVEQVCDEIRDLIRVMLLDYDKLEKRRLQKLQQFLIWHRDNPQPPVVFFQ